MDRAPEQCILCGDVNRALLIAKEQWNVYRCVSCGLGFLDPRPSKKELARLYSEEYCEEYFEKGGQPGTPEFKKRLSLESSRIRFFKGMKRKGHVLDIGCGYGYFLAACREHGYHVHGLDFSDYAVQHAVNHLNLPITVGELSDVELPANSFDVITMWHSLEHTTDPKQAIVKAKEWMKKDGLLIVDVPNHEGTDAVKTWNDWIGWSVPYHFYHFTPRTLKAMLEACGFRVVKTKNYHSETIKQNLKRFPVIRIFARLIARIYSGHSVAMLAEIE